MYKDTIERFDNDLRDLEKVYYNEWLFVYGKTPTQVEHLNMLIRGAIRRVIRMAKKDPILGCALAKKETIVKNMYEEYIIQGGHL